METIGSLFDQLSVVNIKIFFNIEKQMTPSLSDSERLKAADSVVILNKQRNNLIDEIDTTINSCIKNGYSPIKLKMKT